jgi:GTPase SAR1 family protein
VAERIALASLRFGEIDAKTEILSRDKKIRDFFSESFVWPPREVLESLITGDKYVLYGAKGTGKTALLRIMHEDAKKNKNPSSFIVFSEDIANPERQQLLQLAGISEIPKPEMDEPVEVVSAWQLFIYRKIADIFEKNLWAVNNCGNARLFIDLIKEAYDQEKKHWFKRLIEKIKSGKIELSSPHVAKLAMEAELNDGVKESFLIHVFCQNLENLLTKIDFPVDTQFKLFIDEINLALVSLKQHRRDTILVRDLIIATSKVNRIMSENNIPVFVYLAVRSEIVAPRNIAKHEIQKIIESSGVSLEWHRGQNVNNFRIFELVERKIQTSEKALKSRVSPSTAVWNRYFAKDIFGIDPKVFLAEITWCNPRDIIRLLGEAAKYGYAGSNFDTQIMTKALQDYSAKVWDERSEELNTRYSQTEINAMKRVLSSFYPVFKPAQFEQRAKQLAGSDKNIMQMIRTKQVEDILVDLYFVGVVGQSYANYRQGSDSVRERSIAEKWFYREHEEFDKSAWCVVHRGLRSGLNLGPFKARDFEAVATYNDRA